MSGTKNGTDLQEPQRVGLHDKYSRQHKRITTNYRIRTRQKYYNGLFGFRHHQFIMYSVI
jgi:hypothetical protein